MHNLLGHHGPVPAALLAFALVATSSGCTDDPEQLLSTMRVGPAGATFALPSGLSLAVPEGALAGEIDLGMEPIADLTAAGLAAMPDFADGSPALTVALTPHGTTFTQPVTLTLPFGGSPGDTVALRLSDPSDDAWEPVGPLTFGDGTVSLEISEFSVYALVAAGTCPCFGGDQLRSFRTYGDALVRDEGHWRSLYNDERRANGIISIGTSITYKLPGAARSSGQVRTQFWGTTATAHSSTCSHYASAAHPGFIRDFDPPTVTEKMGLTEDEVLSCRALILASLDGDPARQLTVTATGIPAGEALELSLNAASFTVAADDELVFAPNTLPEGSAYAVTIDVQPASAECVLDAAASGTVGAEDIAVAATCAPVSTTPAPVQAACTAIDTLQCDGYTVTGCIETMLAARDEKGGACTSEWDASLTCVAAHTTSTPPSVACDNGSTPPFEFAFPSPCDAEHTAHETCLDAAP